MRPPRKVGCVVKLQHHHHVQQRNVPHQQPRPHPNHPLEHRPCVQATLWTTKCMITKRQWSTSRTLRDDAMSPSRLLAISTSLYAPEPTCPSPSLSSPNDASTSSLRHGALRALSKEKCTFLVFVYLIIYTICCAPLFLPLLLTKVPPQSQQTRAVPLQPPLQCRRSVLCRACLLLGLCSCSVLCLCPHKRRSRRILQVRA